MVVARCCVFFLMSRRPPRSTRTDTPCPYTTLVRSRRGFDARLLARVIVDQFHLVAAPFRPAGVHALQHLGPVLAFGATSARIDLDIGRASCRERVCQYV